MDTHTHTHTQNQSAFREFGASWVHLEWHRLSPGKISLHVCLQNLQNLHFEVCCYACACVRTRVCVCVCVWMTLIVRVPWPTPEAFYLSRKVSGCIFYSAGVHLLSMQATVSFCFVPFLAPFLFVFLLLLCLSSDTFTSPLYFVLSVISFIFPAINCPSPLSHSAFNSFYWCCFVSSKTKRFIHPMSVTCLCVWWRRESFSFFSLLFCSSDFSQTCFFIHNLSLISPHLACFLSLPHQDTLKGVQADGGKGVRGC